MKNRYTYALLTLIAFAATVNGLAWIVATRAKEEPDVPIAYYKPTMKISDAESVMAIISAEGFDQAFNHYSTYRDIEDLKFHELRKAYIAASKELLDYITDSAGKVNNVPYYMSQSSSN